MTLKKGWLLFALLFPIIFLLGLVIDRQYALTTGITLTLPIEAFDPRDLLSGHYLRFSFVYTDPDKVCEQQSNQRAYLCLQQAAQWQATLSAKNNCSIYISGTCTVGRFNSGVERYYIPEQDATQFTKALTNHKASMSIVVHSDGTVQLKKLIIRPADKT